MRSHRRSPTAEGRPDRPVADVRVRQPAHAPLAVRSPAAVPSPLDAAHTLVRRVPARRRVREGVREPAEGRLLRGRREDRRVALAAEVPVLLGCLARPRGGARDRVVHPDAVHEGTERRARARDRDAAEGRQDGVEAADLLRIVAARRRTPRLRRLVGSPRVRARARHGEGALVDEGQRRGGQLRRLCGRDRVRRRQQRHGDGARRAHRGDPLAGALVLALRRPRVLLRDAHRRLRPRLRIEYGRHPVRVRCRHGASALGEPPRLVRLHRSRGLEPDRLRRDVRRQVLRPGRGDGRDALGAGDARRRARRADGDGRARLRRDLRPLRAARRPLGEARARSRRTR